MSGFEAAGRRFRTAAEYQAAKRDLKRIEEIKSKIHMDQPGEVISLSEALAEGQYRFESVIGSEFDDEIYELAERFKSQGYTKNSRLPAGRKARKKAQKKQEKVLAKTEKAKKNRSDKKVSLEDFDADMRKEILAEIKKREKHRRLLVILCSTVAVGCFGYFGVYSYFADRTQMDYEKLALLKGSSSLTGTSWQKQGVTIHYTEDEERELTVLPEYETLYNKNKKLIGWLSIDGTNIDYPVMQTANNEYYLDHNFNQEYDKNGSLFLDAGCDVVNRNTNLIIYGHHMKSGKMFGNLNSYSSKEYCEKHAKIRFDTIYERGLYEVMYVFRSRIFNEDEVVFKYYQFFDAASEKEFDSNMKEMAALSLYDTGVTAVFGDELLTLSTCDSSEQDGRFVVVAKRVVTE
ncbi:MAG: class B sortase [Bacteroidales bacterium]|nr:class B sortase [Bacteroidales bacterium]MCM1415941.1 class B sortase [bacterium]MCM1423547.1 class B sortase [bacterium]